MDLKELLLKDLPARLHYGVKGIITYDKSNTIFTVEGIDNNVLHLSDAEECYVEDFKPYLRPMSSMTEEERNEYFDFRSQELQRVAFAEVGREEAMSEVMDWLLSHHFDIRGLIEKGLALATPKGMY